MRSDNICVAVSPSGGDSHLGLYVSRWDLYSLSAIRVFTHVFFVKVVSILEVHSRPVLHSRDSVRWRLQRFLTIRRPPTAG